MHLKDGSARIQLYFKKDFLGPAWSTVELLDLAIAVRLLIIVLHTWFGFVMGLSIDLFLTTPLGLSALAYAITAYGVGVFQAGMVRRPPAIAPLLGGIGGFFGGLVFLSIGAVVGESGFLSFASLKTVAIAAVYDALIAPIVFPLVRRAARRSPNEATWRVGG